MSYIDDYEGMKPSKSNGRRIPWTKVLTAQAHPDGFERLGYEGGGSFVQNLIN